MTTPDTYLRAVLFLVNADDAVRDYCLMPAGRPAPLPVSLVANAFGKPAEDVTRDARTMHSALNWQRPTTNDNQQTLRV